MGVADCTGKKAYLTYKHAAWDADQLRFKRNHAHSVVYRCRGCQAWHVGESTGRDRVERRPLRAAWDVEGLDS